MRILKYKKIYLTRGCKSIGSTGRYSLIQILEIRLTNKHTMRQIKNPLRAYK
jgi:hypothetical protein